MGFTPLLLSTHKRSVCLAQPKMVFGNDGPVPAPRYAGNRATLLFMVLQLNRSYSGQQLYNHNDSGATFEIQLMWLVPGCGCRSSARTPRLHLTAQQAQTHVYRFGHFVLTHPFDQIENARGSSEQGRRGHLSLLRGGGIRRVGAPFLGGHLCLSLVTAPPPMWAPPMWVICRRRGGRGDFAENTYSLYASQQLPPGEFPGSLRILALAT